MSDFYFFLRFPTLPTCASACIFMHAIHWKRSIAWRAWKFVSTETQINWRIQWSCWKMESTFSTTGHTCSWTIESWLRDLKAVVSRQKLNYLMQLEHVKYRPKISKMCSYNTECTVFNPFLPSASIAFGGSSPNTFHIIRSILYSVQIYIVHRRIIQIQITFLLALLFTCMNSTSLHSNH